MQGMSLFDVERTLVEDRQQVIEPGPGESPVVMEPGPGESHDVPKPVPGETQFMTVSSRAATAAQKRALWTFLPSYSVEAAVQVQREERQLSIIYI